jgi:hypothetical protein
LKYSRTPRRRKIGGIVSELLPAGLAVTRISVLARELVETFDPHERIGTFGRTRPAGAPGTAAARMRRRVKLEIAAVGVGELADQGGGDLVFDHGGGCGGAGRGVVRCMISA